MRASTIDYTGKKYNLLTGVEFADFDKFHKARWKWLCDCGNTVIIATTVVIHGKSKSCGCLNLAAITKHGFSRKINRPPSEIGIWYGIKNRCLSPGTQNYIDYGARGIRICAGFLVFENFHRIMGVRPSLEYSADRNDNRGHYSCGECDECLANGWPLNIRWATRFQQMRNTHYTRYITFKDRTMPINDWADEIGIDVSTLSRRIKKWGLKNALTTPKLNHSDRVKVRYQPTLFFGA